MVDRRILVAAGIVLLGVAIQLIIVARDDKRSSGRSTGMPAEVVDRYLRYRLIDRDTVAARALQCRSPSLTTVDGYVADLTDREQRFNVTIASSWTGLQSSAASTGEATVRLDLIKTVTPDTERVSAPWTFGLTDENGWKVCSAQPSSP